MDLKLKKAISVLVIITFLFSNIAYGEPSSRQLFKGKKVDQQKLSDQKEETLKKTKSVIKGEETSASSQPSKQASQKILSSHLEDLSQIHIPTELGSVIEVYQAPKNPSTNSQAPLIVNIQDLHTNPEGQLNLASILEILLKDYNMGVICSEGADGKVDTSSVSSFPDKEVREKTARLFINSGELTGEEYLSITKYPDLPIWGIENKDVYFKNIEQFNKIMGYNPQSKAFISQVKKALGELKPKVYSKEILVLDQKEADYEAQNIKTDAYLKDISSYIQKLNIPTDSYPNIAILNETVQAEKKIDQQKIMQDTQNLLLNLQTAIQAKNIRSDMDSLMAKAQLFKEQKISPFSFYSYLKDLAQKHLKDQMSKYQDLNEFIDYLTKVNSLDSTKLFIEMEALTFDIKQRLAKRDEEKTLTQALRNIKFLEGFFDLKISNEELKYYLQNKDSHKIGFFEAFLKPAINKYNIDASIDFNPDLIDAKLSEIEEFYQTVKSRDGFMFNNTIAQVEKRNSKITALVTGGFHTKGITSLLREKGYSYIVVAPFAKSQIDEENYHFLLSGKRKPVEDLIKQLDTPEELTKKPSQNKLRVPVGQAVTLQRIKDLMVADTSNEVTRLADVLENEAKKLADTLSKEIWDSQYDPKKLATKNLEEQFIKRIVKLEGIKESVPALIEAAKSNRNSIVRAAFIRALGEIGAREARNGLLDIWRDEPKESTIVRKALVKAFPGIGLSENEIRLALELEDDLTHQLYPEVTDRAKESLSRLYSPTKNNETTLAKFVPPLTMGGIGYYKLRELEELKEKLLAGPEKVQVNVYKLAYSLTSDSKSQEYKNLAEEVFAKLSPDIQSRVSTVKAGIEEEYKARGQGDYALSDASSTTMKERFASIIPQKIEGFIERLSALKGKPIVSTSDITTDDINEVNGSSHDLTSPIDSDIHYIGEEDASKYTEEAETMVLNGNIVSQKVFGGDATRLKMPGSKFLFNGFDVLNNKLENFQDLDVRKAVKEMQELYKENGVLNISLGARAIIQERLELERLAKKYGRDPKEALKNYKFIVQISDKSDDIIEEFRHAGFFGFSRENVIFTAQDTFPGYAVRDGKVVPYEDQNLKFAQGNAYTFTQAKEPGVAFYIDKNGKKAYLKDTSALQYFKDKGAMLTSDCQAEDLDKLNPRVIDIERIALALKLMKEGKFNVVADGVTNEKKEPCRISGTFDQTNKQIIGIKNQISDIPITIHDVAIEGNKVKGVVKEKEGAWAFEGEIMYREGLQIEISGNIIRSQKGGFFVYDKTLGRSMWYEGYALKSKKHADLKSPVLAKGEHLWSIAALLENLPPNEEVPVVLDAKEDPNTKQPLLVVDKARIELTQLPGMNTSCILRRGVPIKSLKTPADIAETFKTFAEQDKDAEFVGLAERIYGKNIYGTISKTDEISLAKTEESMASNLQEAIKGNKDAYAAIKNMNPNDVISYFEAGLKDTVTNLPEDLFGRGYGYDIRGNALEIKNGIVDMTPENMYAIGKLLALKYCKPDDRFLVTGDMRLHTPTLRYVMALGAASVGVDIDFSEEALSTGAHNVYSAENPKGYKVQIQLSGSHGVYQKNGAKIKADIGNGRLDPVYGEELAALYNGRQDILINAKNRNVKDVNMHEISGIEDAIVDMYDKSLPSTNKDEILVIDARAGGGGNLVAKLLAKRGYEVIDVDGVFGTLGQPSDMNALLANQDNVANILDILNKKWDSGKHKVVFMLNMHPDPLMGRGIWDPSKPEAMVPAVTLIKAINGSFGDKMPQAIGGVFDGDADRVGAVKENGEDIPAFEMTIPYYQRFLLDPKNKAAIIDMVKAGGEPLWLACDVRANSKLNRTLSNLGNLIKEEGALATDPLKSVYINTGYPPQLAFIAWRIEEMKKFVDSKPELKGNPEFMANFKNLIHTYYTAEASGHNFFHASPGNPERSCDCAIAAFVSLINIKETIGDIEAPVLGIEKENANSLVTLFEKFPSAFTSNEIRVVIPNSVKIPTAHKLGAWLQEKYGAELLSQKAEKIKMGDLEYEPVDNGLVTVSGYKVQLKNGDSILIRWSNTGEQLTLLFEGHNMNSLVTNIATVLNRMIEEQQNVAGLKLGDLEAELKRLKDANKAEKLTSIPSVTINGIVITLPYSPEELREILSNANRTMDIWRLARSLTMPDEEIVNLTKQVISNFPMHEQRLIDAIKIKIEKQLGENKMKQKFEEVQLQPILDKLENENAISQLDYSVSGKSYEDVNALNPQWARSGFDENKKGMKLSRFGWTLENVKWILKNPAKVQQVLDDAEYIRNNYKYAIFCGMGGSGLSVQTVKTTFGEPKDLTVYSLRTTDPATVKAILEDIAKREGCSIKDALKYVHIKYVSKSGTTQETVDQKKYFEDLYDLLGIPTEGRMMVVTDKGSPMDTGRHKQREIQLNGKDDTGGRFTSPTTNVFLLPLALVAPDKVKTVLEKAVAMNEKSDINDDTFVKLGVYWYYMAAKMGKDKLTFMVPKEFQDLPMWSEQLVEESLGKDGKGVTIFYGEDISEASLKDVKENDRVFLRINIGGKKTNDELWQRLKAEGYPVREINVDDIDSIGGIMLGLQRAVATVGYLWDICFVNQPAVEGYKNATREVMSKLQPGEKVEVPNDWKSVSFGKLKLYYDRLMKVRAVAEEELQLEVQRLGSTMDDAAAVYAAIINILRTKPGFEAKEITNYGKLTDGMRDILQKARADIFTNGLRMPSKLGEGPDKNHSYHQNIEDGKDMWLSTYFMPLKIEQPEILKYDDNTIRAQTIGTVNSVTNVGRKVMLITFDSTTKDAEGDVKLFFEKVANYLKVAPELKSKALDILKKSAEDINSGI